MPIYVITAGTYDDYHVVACTTDLDAANRALKFAAKNSWEAETANIEIYEDCKEAFNDMNLDEKNFYQVIVDRGHVKVTKSTHMSFEYCQKLMCDGPDVIHYGLDHIYRVVCCAPDEEHAKEIACEAIMKFKIDERSKHDAQV